VTLIAWWWWWRWWRWRFQGRGSRARSLREVRIVRLPAAAQCHEKHHLVVGQLRLAGGQRRFARGQRALGIERVEVAGAPVLVELARLPRDDGALVARGFERGAAVELARVVAQRGLGLAQRGEHGAVELRERAARAGLGLRDARLHHAGVGNGPRDQRAEAVAHAVLAAEVGGGAGRQGLQADRHVRVQVGRGHADARGGRGQRALGLADVGPAAQQLRAVAHGQHAGHARRRGAVGHLARKVLRQRAGERGQAVQRGLPAGLQRRQRGVERLQLRTRAARVDGAGAAGLLQALGDVDGVLLQADGLLRDLQAQAGGTGFGIRARGARGNVHAHQVERGFGRLGVGGGGLDGAAQLAEQVDLVRQRRAQPVVEGARRLVAALQQLDARLVAVRRAAVHADGGVLAAGHFVVDGAFALQVGHGLAQVGVVRERLRDEAVEQRVVVQAPPVRGQRRGAGGRARGGAREGLAGSALAGQRFGRLLVVGADRRTGRERGGGRPASRCGKCRG
jgi:hypothetical protein